MIPDQAMKTLALDTSTSRGSVALLRGIELVGELRICSSDTHSARLLRAVDFLVSTSGWDLADLELIASGIGPGSFTGIRIGLATALGLAQSLSLPFAGISGLDALAHEVSFLEGDIGVVMDAQRRQVYYAEYHSAAGRLRRSRKPSLWYPEELENIIRRRHDLNLVGDAARHFCAASREPGPKFIPVDLYLAGGIGRLAIRRKRSWRRGEFLTAEPLYIRPPDALKPRKPKV
jgi:tRNA threonylcarbamoyladenosine biosynthesis protein TsaB